MSQELIKAHQEHLQAVRTSAKLHAEKLELEKRQLIDERFPELALQRAQFEFDMHMAKRLFDGGALPKGETPEMQYMKIKAGREIGLSEIASINAFAFVNGRMMIWGKPMVALVTGKGYRLEYLNEIPGKELTVRCFLPDGSFDVKEKVSSSDPTISGKGKFGLQAAPQNKLRYHGIRKILDFHLAHLVADVDAASMVIEEQKTYDVPHVEVSNNHQKEAFLAFIANADLDTLLPEENTERYSEKAVELDCLTEFNARIDELELQNQTNGK